MYIYKFLWKSILRRAASFELILQLAFAIKQNNKSYYDNDNNGFI